MRKILTLTLSGRRLVNTINFTIDKYAGCPLNAVRIFSQLDVEEIILLNISKTPLDPNYLKYLSRFVSHSQVPIGYGGGISDINIANDLHNFGFDKLLFSNQSRDLALISKLSKLWGRQSISVIFNLSKTSIGFGGLKNFSVLEEKFLKKFLSDIHKIGVGELVFQSISSEGSRAGFPFLSIPKCFYDYKDSFQYVFSGGNTFNVLNFPENLNFPTDNIALSFSTDAIYHGKLKAILPRWF